MSTGCITGGYSRPVPSLSKQRETILAENNQKYRLGKLHADLGRVTAKTAVAATEGFWIRYTGVRDDVNVCFETEAAMSAGLPRWVRADAEEWAGKLRNTMLVVQAHDTLDQNTKWEKRKATDARSATIVDEKIEKKISKLKKSDGTPYVSYRGSFVYEVCAALPPVPASTRYLTIRWAPNSDGQQLFVYRVAAGDESPVADDGGDEDQAPAADAGYRAPADAPTAISALAAAGNYTMFLAALQKHGVDIELAGPGPFTILAPTDEAFAKLTEQRRRRILADKERLPHYLREHIIIGAFPPTEDKELRREGKTLGNTTRRIFIKNDRFRIGAYYVSTPPISASNALIYAIDEVSP